MEGFAKCKELLEFQIYFLLKESVACSIKIM